MDYKIQEVGKLVYHLIFTIPKEEVAERTEEELKKLKKTVEMPGFRKGKVPLELIKARYASAVEEDVIEEIARKRTNEILSKENYKIYGPAYLVDIKKLENGDYEIKSEFEIEPEIELQKIDGLRVIKEVRKVRDEDVEAVLESLRKDQAVMQKVEDGAKSGHYVLADFQEVDAGGTPIIGKKFKDRFFRLGEGIIGEQLEKQLEGVKPGEERKIEINYEGEESQGEEQKKEFYQVQVKEIQDHVLPELDDEFAKSLGDFESLEALKERIRKDLEERFEYESQEKLRELIIDEVIKSNPFDVPSRMVDTYVEYAYEESKKDKKEKIDKEIFAKEFRPYAIRQLKWMFIREKLVEQENLQATDEEVEAEIEKIIENTPRVNGDEIRRYYKNPENRKRLKDRIEERKAIERLLQKAKIEEMDVTPKNSDIIQTT